MKRTLPPDAAGTFGKLQDMFLIVGVATPTQSTSTPLWVTILVGAIAAFIGHALRIAEFRRTKRLEVYMLFVSAANNYLDSLFVEFASRGIYPTPGMPESGLLERRRDLDAELAKLLLIAPSRTVANSHIVDVVAMDIKSKIDTIADDEQFAEHLARLRDSIDYFAENARRDVTGSALSRLLFRVYRLAVSPPKWTEVGSQTGPRPGARHRMVDRAWRKIAEELRS